MRKSNSNHDLVIDSLQEALLQLMEVKKIDNITISELCRKAGVSRISFYRNYDYISDILVKFLSADLDYWWRENSGERAEDMSVFWKKLFTHLKQHEHVIKLIYHSNASFILKDIVFSSCGPIYSQTDEEAYARAMLAGVIFGYTDEWIKRGMKSYPEYISLSSILKILGQK